MACLPKNLETLSLPIEESLKFTLGALIQLYTNHQVSNLLQDNSHFWLSDNRLLKYQALYLENPDITIFTRETLNLVVLLLSPEEDTPFHCQEILSLTYSPRANLTDEPL